MCKHQRRIYVTACSHNQPCLGAYACLCQKTPMRHLGHSPAPYFAAVFCDGQPLPCCLTAAERTLLIKATLQSTDSAPAVQTALKLQPNFADACNNLASIFSQLGDVPRAVEYYNAALRINPRIVDVHQNLGDLWLSQVPLLGSLLRACQPRMHTALRCLLPCFDGKSLSAACMGPMHA